MDGPRCLDVIDAYAANLAAQSPLYNSSAYSPLVFPVTTSSYMNEGVLDVTAYLSVYRLFDLVSLHSVCVPENRAKFRWHEKHNFVNVAV